MNNKPYGVPVKRLNQGNPIISPNENWWENNVTFNTTCYYLERSASNDPIIKTVLGVSQLNDPRLAKGVVAMYYRARPKTDPGHKWTRSFIGLAVFTPELDLLKRYAEPVLAPGEAETDFDCLGVEDPRISRINGKFYMVYCSVGEDPQSDYSAKVSLAVSTDLVHWEKCGAVQGEVNRPGYKNKDGVLFEDKINGKYYLMHRPYNDKLPLSDFSMHLAMADSINGKWKNCGEILHSFKNPNCRDSWVGAGSVPIHIGNQQYIVIYHTGNYLNEQVREYDLDVALFDFNQFDPAHPDSVVTKRLEPFMVPETEAEIKAPFADSVANVLFACGSYVYQGDIYIIYGGGDTYTMAARVNQKTLLDYLMACDLSNPFLK